jgi:putative DNA primase/helicase
MGTDTGICTVCGLDRLDGCTCLDTTDLVLAEDEVVEGEVVDDDQARADDQHDHDPHHVNASMRLLPPPTNPTAVAAQWMDENHAPDGTYLIRRHKNTFFEYTGTSWVEIEEARLRSELYAYTSGGYFVHPKNGMTAWEPTSRKIGDLMEALGALVFLDGSLTAPVWLDGGTEAVVPFANGLLDLETRTLHPHTPAYFGHHLLPFEYDPKATCPRWMQFVGELWPDDPDSIEALQEVMGYLLAGATQQQKLFGLVGPKRSGKGTIGRVLTGLLGAHNVAAPTLSGLTTNFGMSPLIGRPLAIISDARLGRKSDSSVAVERLLSVSGEDSITIDRKYRDPWTGRLPTRFLILTNEIPQFADASGALASRFILLVLDRSWYGREDPTLTDQLLGEASGILTWALEGLDRLTQRGHFDQPPSAREALRRLEDLGAPVGAFVRDRCVVGTGRQVGKDVLWAAWKAWCTDEGRSTPGTKAVFGRDLSAAFPGIKATRPRIDGERVHLYEGICLRAPGDGDDDEGLLRGIPSPTVEKTPDHPDQTPDQTSLVTDRVQTGSEQTRRSEQVVRGGQGSSALYRPQNTTPDQTSAQIPDRPKVKTVAVTVEQPPRKVTKVVAHVVLGPGSIVRRLGGLKSKRFKVKETRGDQVDAWEIESGQAVKLRTFHTDELVLIEEAK